MDCFSIHNDYKCIWIRVFIVVLNNKLDTEGIRITFRCIDKHHPKRRFYVVLKVNDEEKWECWIWMNIIHE